MAKNKIDPKEVGLSVLMGSSVVVLTPIISGLISGVPFMATEILPGMLSIGTAISAGASAFLVDLGISKWLRK